MMRNKQRRTRERGAESFRGDDEGFVLAVGVSPETDQYKQKKYKKKKWSKVSRGPRSYTLLSL